MKFLIVSHADHFRTSQGLSSYAPYVKEMNMWLNYVDEVEVLAPLGEKTTGLDMAYRHPNINHISIPALGLTSISNVIRSMFMAPLIILKLVAAMRRVDHIHLRCPGNVGLLGCMVQVFFPKKKKTAKYAGNWDPKAKQPLSYRLQKYMLSNTRLTKNMCVLAYGDWPAQSINVKSFFTATYGEEKKLDVPPRRFDLPYRFLFVGGLAPGKRPLYAIKLVEALNAGGIPSELHLYGDGVLRPKLEKYLSQNDLHATTFLYGNKDAGIVEQAYRKSHFVLLPSKSEGWPKVIAEGMWWGAVPIVTSISCVPWMLGEGSRGILIEGKLKKDVKKLMDELQHKNALRSKSNKAQMWSRKYTLDRFEAEIKKLL